MIVTIVAVYYRFRDTAPEADDEETAPLRRSDIQACERPDSGETDDDEDEPDDGDKKFQERLDKFEAKLKEQGNWLTYVRRFKVFWPHLWPYGRPTLQLRMVGVGLCVLAGRALTILAPNQLGVLTNALGRRSPSDSFTALLIYTILAWLNSYAGLEWLRQILWLPVESNAEQQLEIASYNHIMELSCDFHDQKNSGELYTSMYQGESIVSLLERLLYDLFPTIIDLLLACFYFYYLFNVYLVLIGVSIIVAFFWVSVHLSHRQVKMRRRTNMHYRKKRQVLYDTMGGWRTVTYFNAVQHAEKKYATNVRKNASISRKSTRLWFSTYATQATILDIGGLFAHIFAAYQVVYGGRDVGTFVTLVTYWGSFTGQLPFLTSLHRAFMRGLVDAEELLTLFQQSPSVTDGPNEMSVREGNVVFDKIQFSYDGKKENIRDISFTGSPGKTIALVGETGAGKTTLLKLLFRFYDVTSGSIVIDGQDIRNVTLSSLREHIGVVPQDPSLFNDTVWTNIRFARRDATDEEVIEACKAAAVHDKILTFTDGYKSKVGENGVRLSGGELQRVAIARAMLKNPKIILLDEATSSVDSETEEKIQEGLRRLCKGRTTFVVAHRLSTIMDADQVIVVKDGTILEQGTPKELLAGKGKYHKLWTKQMGITDTTARDSEDSGDSPTTTLPVEGSSDSLKGDERRKKTPANSQHSSESAKGKAVSQTDGAILTAQKDADQGHTVSKKTSPSVPPIITSGKPVESKSSSCSTSKSPFRPEAPEFVPRSHRTGDSVNERVRRFETSSSQSTDKATGQRTYRQSTDAGSSSTRDDASGVTTGASRADSSTATRSLSSHGGALSRSDPEPSTEPGRHSFGADSFDGPARTGSSSIFRTDSSRHVSSPSEPSPASDSLRALAHQTRRRRQRHSTGGRGEGSAESVERRVMPISEEEEEIGSSDGARLPQAPHPSPAGASTPKERTRPGSSVD